MVFVPPTPPKPNKGDDVVFSRSAGSNGTLNASVYSANGTYKFELIPAPPQGKHVTEEELRQWLESQGFAVNKVGSSTTFNIR